eukprot:1326215-Rhodomonas_salina.1
MRFLVQRGPQDRINYDFNLFDTVIFLYALDMRGSKLKKGGVSHATCLCACYAMLMTDLQYRAGAHVLAKRYPVLAYVHATECPLLSLLWRICLRARCRMAGTEVASGVFAYGWPVLRQHRDWASRRVLGKTVPDAELRS